MNLTTLSQDQLSKQARYDLEKLSPGVKKMMDFGLIEALLGRRSRRFFQGAEIPDGVFKYKSRKPPLPLTELEKLLDVAACGGNTSWHHMIYRGDPYAPHLSNYAEAAGGRTFPSGAGFQTSTTFFTFRAWSQGRKIRTRNHLSHGPVLF